MLFITTIVRATCCCCCSSFWAGFDCIPLPFLGLGRRVRVKETRLGAAPSAVCSRTKSYSVVWRFLSVSSSSSHLLLFRYGQSGELPIRSFLHSFLSSSSSSSRTLFGQLLAVSLSRLPVLVCRRPLHVLHHVRF